MKKRFPVLAVATLFAMVCVTGVAAAGSLFSHSSSTKSFDLIVDQPVTVAPGTELQPGTYRVHIPLDTQKPEVEFDQYGKVIAKVPATVQSEATKNPHTEFTSEDRGGTHVMTEIDPNGMNERFILNTTGKQKTKS